MSEQTSNELKGNDKRKASCKKIGGEKKRGGHSLEKVFDEAVGVCSTTTSTKPEADCTIVRDGERGKALVEKLEAVFGPLTSFHCSLKSGNNLQFTLGVIPEITQSETKIAAMSQPSLWEKYLGKSKSNKPAELLVYFDKVNWIFFKMSDVIDFIVKNSTWRLLETGRLKGDFKDDTRKGFSQYLTYEYRSTHKSYFLGANGGKGKPFIELLMKNLKFVKTIL
jgi:hypothetical protein